MFTYFFEFYFFIFKLTKFYNLNNPSSALN
jgi:hypothetical protein